MCESKGAYKSFGCIHRIDAIRRLAQMAHRALLSIRMVKAAVKGHAPCASSWWHASVPSAESQRVRPPSLASRREGAWGYEDVNSEQSDGDQGRRMDVVITTLTAVCALLVYMYVR